MDSQLRHRCGTKLPACSKQIEHQKHKLLIEIANLCILDFGPIMERRRNMLKKIRLTALSHNSFRRLSVAQFAGFLSLLQSAVGGMENIALILVVLKTLQNAYPDLAIPTESRPIL